MFKNLILGLLVVILGCLGTAAAITGAAAAVDAHVCHTQGGHYSVSTSLVGTCSWS
jgi:hypothetical protein